MPPFPWVQKERRPLRFRPPVRSLGGVALELTFPLCAKGWRKALRTCLHCLRRFKPKEYLDLYCSAACDSAPPTAQERAAAEAYYALEFEGDFERHGCRICRRGWRECLRKFKDGRWWCFTRYHYDTPLGPGARLAGGKWVWACWRCNLLEKDIRRRNPARWPRGISPGELWKTTFSFRRVTSPSRGRLEDLGPGDYDTDEMDLYGFAFHHDIGDK